MNKRKEIEKLIRSGARNIDICHATGCCYQYVSQIRQRLGIGCSLSKTETENRYDKNFKAVFEVEWNAAVQRIRRCFK